MKPRYVTGDVVAVGLVLIAFGFALGATVVESQQTAAEPQRAMIQTRLVVPVPCLEALDHGDNLTMLLGEAIGDAADSATTSEQLVDLLSRATSTNENYKRAAVRCRQLGDDR